MTDNSHGSDTAIAIVMLSEPDIIAEFPVHTGKTSTGGDRSSGQMSIPLVPTCGIFLKNHCWHEALPMD